MKASEYSKPSTPREIEIHRFCLTHHRKSRKQIAEMLGLKSASYVSQIYGRVQSRIIMQKIKEQQNAKVQCELTEQLWAVALADRIIKTDITYKEAMRIVKQKPAQADEICIITAEAAARFNQPCGCHKVHKGKDCFGQLLN